MSHKLKWFSEEREMGPMSSRVSSIDGLRGLCALLIIPFHFAVLDLGIYQFELSKIIANQLFIGVQIFFVLSGYLVLKSSLAHFDRECHVFPNFYIRRGFRIFPIWLCFIGANLVFRNFDSAFQFLSYTTLTFGLFPSLPQPESFIHAWSLFVEESFYILFPIVFFLVRKPIGAIFTFVFTILLSVFAGDLLSLAYSNLMPSQIYVSATYNFHYIAAGMLCFHVFESRQYRRLIEVPLVRQALVIGLVIGLVMSLGFGFHRIDFIVGMLALALILYEQGVVARLMRSRPLTLCGRNCYAIYVFHPMIMFSVHYQLQGLQLDRVLGWPAETNYLFLLVYIPLIVLVGHILTKSVEGPGVMWGRRFLNRIEVGAHA